MLRATSSKTVQTREHHAFSRIMQDNSSFHTLKTYLVIKETQCDTVFCMQFFNARNCFKHISRSTSGTFAATQPPYSFACKELIFYFFQNNHQPKTALGRFQKAYSLPRGENKPGQHNSLRFD